MKGLILELLRKFGFGLILAVAAWGGGAMGQPSIDYRHDFPPVFTETPMGVNSQTGKFRYHPYSIAVGPFTLQRGFNQSDFAFLGRIYAATQRTAGGGQMTLVHVALGESRMEFFLSLIHI